MILFKYKKVSNKMLCIYIMSSIGGLSMRPGLPAIPKYSYINKRKNYILSMKQRPTGLLKGSGTLNNNI